MANGAAEDSSAVLLMHGGKNSKNSKNSKDLPWDFEQPKK
jgi:hypothetical protein